MRQILTLIIVVVEVSIEMFILFQACALVKENFQIQGCLITIILQVYATIKNISKDKEMLYTCVHTHTYTYTHIHMYIHIVLVCD